MINNNTILAGREALAREVEQVAEVAGYLWQKGWAERNGGNITVNVTEFVDDEIRQMPAIAEPVALGAVLSNLYGPNMWYPFIVSESPYSQLMFPALSVLSEFCTSFRLQHLLE